MGDPVGQQLGNYRLVRLIGQGGFADVYLGEHVHLKTQGAVKVFQVRLMNDDLTDFFKEVRTIASLAHPNIVRVLDFGLEGDTPFLVTEYASNGSLRQRYPKGTHTSIEALLPFITQTASALHFAHTMNIVHRDVKPENILLGPNNEVLLSDFGLALLTQSSRDQSMDRVKGTAAYMAPEQFQGKTVAASDQYALGIVVYELLCGERPFTGSFTELYSQHVFVPAPPLRTKLPTLAADIEEVIMMALAKDPQKRFGNMLAFATALQQACEPRQQLLYERGAQPAAPIIFSSMPAGANDQTYISPFPASTGETVTPQYQQALPLSTQPGVLKTQPVMQPVEMTLPAAPYPAWAPFAEVPVTPPPPPPFMLPGSAQSQPKQVSRRGFIIGLAGGALGVAGLGSFLLTQHFLNGPRAAATPTPNQQSTVTPGPSSPVATPSSAPARVPVVYRGHPSEVYTVAWSPNGARIASGGNGEMVEVWDPVTGNQFSVYHSNTAKTYSVAWSPNGQYIASGHQDGSVRIWDPSSGRFISGYHGHKVHVNTVAWSPDGQYIASGSADKTVQVWQANSGQLITTYTGHTSYINAVAWSHSGQYIASGGGDSSVQVWSALTGQAAFSYHNHLLEVLAVSWSPDDGQIASAGEDDTVQIWSAFSGNTSIVYRGHTAYVVAMAWSPNGQYIASGGVDTQVKVWSAATGGTLYTFHGHNAEVEGLAWSPSSKYVASASDDFTVQVWQAV